MDTLRRLFSGKPIGDKRWWFVLGACLILAAVIRPLLSGSSSDRQERALPASTRSSTPAASPASAPAEPAKLPSLLQSQSKPDGLTFRQDPSPGTLLWRMFASLVGVIVLIVVGGIVVRRYLMSRIVQPSGKRVAVLESTRLASRQTVHLVQAGTRKYLLAATPEQVSLVADVTEAFGKDEAPIA